MAITFARATATSGWGNQCGMSASITIPDIVANSSTFNIPTATGTITNWAYNTSTYPQSTTQTYSKYAVEVLINGTGSAQLIFSNNGNVYLSEVSGWTSKAWTSTYTYSTSRTTSDFFNSSNPTTRSVPVTLERIYWGIDGYTYTSTATGTGTASLTLDVPPTATVSAMSYDTGFIYAGLTTASVTISNAAAYYGGSVSDVTLKIGTQTDSISGNGTCSIALDTAGTFTPTVTVTDSRGQTKTYTLSQITVNSYSAPTVSFTAERTTSAGKPDDEGTYATATSMFIFADAIADLIAPSVVLTDENGTQSTPTVTWYTTRAADGTLSGVISDWSNVSAGDTVYGLVPGLNTNYSYQISIRPRDSQGTGTAISQTVASAFYTIDFLAGGHGIAFGQPSSQAGFECNMPTIFHDTVDIEDDADFGADIFIELPNYQTSGVDKDIYDAVVALGWDSEVIV